MNRCTVLLVDDSESDIFFFKRAVADIQLNCDLQVCKDGQQAIEYLSRQGPYAERAVYPLPTLIVINLQMPRMGGLELLKWLKSQPRLKALPAIILSALDSRAIITQAYELGANAFMTKSATYDGLLLKLETLTRFWLEQCKHPNVEEEPGGTTVAA
jgi:CheY-like chemotaxis protein